ncbi:hypothetical protein RhiirA4_424516, partial [Rhizophagus irregularis]
MKDCEKVVVISELHSDEWSSEDEDPANKEKNPEKRPESLDKLNSVIKIHKKNVNLQELARRILRRVDECIRTGLIRMRHHLDNVIDNKSRLTEEMPFLPPRCQLVKTARTAAKTKMKVIMK